MLVLHVSRLLEALKMVYSGDLVLQASRCARAILNAAMEKPPMLDDDGLGADKVPCDPPTRLVLGAGSAAGCANAVPDDPPSRPVRGAGSVAGGNDAVLDPPPRGSSGALVRRRAVQTQFRAIPPRGFARGAGPAAGGADSVPCENSSAGRGGSQGARWAAPVGVGRERRKIMRRKSR